MSVRWRRVAHTRFRENLEIASFDELVATEASDIGKDLGAAPVVRQEKPISIVELMETAPTRTAAGAVKRRQTGHEIIVNGVKIGEPDHRPAAEIAGKNRTQAPVGAGDPRQKTLIGPDCPFDLRHGATSPSPVEGRPRPSR